MKLQEGTSHDHQLKRQDRKWKDFTFTHLINPSHVLIFIKDLVIIFTCPRLSPVPAVHTTRHMLQNKNYRTLQADVDTCAVKDKIIKNNRTNPVFF